MNKWIKINPIKYPYLLNDLKKDNPSKSFSSNPSDIELAYFDVYKVYASNKPNYDYETQKIIEIEPIQINGVWTQQWGIIELTEQEKREIYIANHPPKWIEFNKALPQEIDELLIAIQNISPRLAMSLAIGLGQAKDGDYSIFLSTWKTIQEFNLINLELVDNLQNLAKQFDLPDNFINLLSLNTQL
jgi:hypothetical protein